MDPNETLKRIRELARRVRETERVDPNNFSTYTANADELAFAIDALDSWITRGGFLPSDWSKGR